EVAFQVGGPSREDGQPSILCCGSNLPQEPRLPQAGIPFEDYGAPPALLNLTQSSAELTQLMLSLLQRRHAVPHEAQIENLRVDLRGPPCGELAPEEEDSWCMKLTLVKADQFVPHPLRGYAQRRDRTQQKAGTNIDHGGCERLQLDVEIVGDSVSPKYLSR